MFLGFLPFINPKNCFDGPDSYVCNCRSPSIYRQKPSTSLYQVSCVGTSNTGYRVLYRGGFSRELYSYTWYMTHFRLCSFDKRPYVPRTLLVYSTRTHSETFELVGRPYSIMTRRTIISRTTTEDFRGKWDSSVSLTETPVDTRKDEDRRKRT